MLEFQQLFKLKYTTLITHVVFIFFLIGNAYSETHNVLLIENFKSTLQSANPGDEVVVKNGEYPDVNFGATVNGSAVSPIIIRPETPGGVKFTGKSGIRFKGGDFIFRDFYFFRVQHDETSDPQSIRNSLEIRASDCEILHNVFYQCGRLDTALSSIIRLKDGAQRNRVAYNTLIDSLSQGIQIIHNSTESDNVDNIIEYNAFYDIDDVEDVHPTMSPVNGMEAIQLGGSDNASQPGNDSIARHNYFENVVGDKAEIISNKTRGSTISFNTFMNCDSMVSLRHGHECLVEGNFFFNTTPPGTLTSNAGNTSY